MKTLNSLKSNTRCKPCQETRAKDPLTSCPNHQHVKRGICPRCDKAATLVPRSSTGLCQTCHRSVRGSKDAEWILVRHQNVTPLTAERAKIFNDLRKTKDARFVEIGEAWGGVSKAAVRNWYYKYCNDSRIKLERAHPIDSRPVRKGNGNTITVHGGGARGVAGCNCKLCVARRREYFREKEANRRLRLKAAEQASVAQ